MKRITLFGLVCLVLLMAGASGFSQTAPTGSKQPVYIYLYARVTDQINLDLTEDRLRRLLPMIEKYREEHPQGHVSATILFSGAVSRALMQRNRETHILDFVLDYIHRGIIQAGYDGMDEPTYRNRPVIDFSGAKTAEQRWVAREAAADRLLTQGRDPLTGAEEPDVSGSLKEMQRVFGPAVYIAGVKQGQRDVTGNIMPELGGDSELVRELDRLNSNAILSGISGNSAHIPGFAGWLKEFAEQISPAPETSPEIYWQDNRLRFSDSSIPPVRLMEAYSGPSAIAAVLDKIDRSRVQVIHVELGNERDYLKPIFARGPMYPPIRFAYENPEHPTLPQIARSEVKDVDSAYAKEADVIKWLLEDYFPANPGSRFVSSTDLKQMIAPSTGFDVSVAGLQATLPDGIKTWGDTQVPPSYFEADGHYLSLADTFQVLTDALAALNRTGTLPREIRVAKVYGPLEMPEGNGAGKGEVTPASIASVCARIERNLHDDGASPVPKNAIPSSLTLEGFNVNAAQFLRLMAEALLSQPADKKFDIKMSSMFSKLGADYARTRLREDDGAMWTVKPASLEIPHASDSAASGLGR